MKRHQAFLFLVLCCFVQLSLQQQCSESNHCPEGCCSSAGYCGYGPEYCGKGCQSTCDRKSECNPGWDSNDFSTGEKCPLNVCCSEHGFCGYTEEFCKDDEVERPSCSPSKEVKRVIGYFEAWAPAKRTCYSMLPEEIPFGQYTDIIFSFATINPDTFKVSAGDSQTQYLLERMKSLKIIQPDLKIWVALGGWAFNDPGPTQTTFSDIASSEDNIDTFLDSLVSMMNTYSLDGVDIDWEYPVAEDRHGKDEDFENIVTFMKKLRSRMSAADRGTSMAIPASYWYLRHFDIKALEPQVDWFNLMSYDMHGSWDIDNEFTGPWANSHTNMTEIQMALDLLWRNDISASKVTMGMAFYSRTFTLTDPNCNKLGCRVSSGGNAGECSDTVGVLLHPEIADIVADKKLTPVPDRTGAVKIVSWDNQWTTFDDAATWRLKGNIARSQCIEGFMVWAMSQDDSKGTNIKALNQALGRKTPDFPDFTPSDPPDPLPASNPKLCRWTSCFEGCPSGFKEVQRDGHKEIMMDTSICFDEDDKFSNHIGFARLCCPSENTLPTCTWRGHKNSGNCRPGCEDDEVEVGTLKTGCKKNHQSACCKSTSVTESYGECFWSDCSKDAATICGQSLTLVTTSPNGWGGHKQCSGDYEARALCCNDPPPAAFDTSCKWYPKVGLHDDNKFCEGACPKDSVKLSLWLGFHWVKGSEYCYGYNAFCCPDPKQIVERDDGYEEDQISQQWAKQFRKLLEEYAEDPTCPRDDLDLAFHDDRARGYDAKKRSLTVESNQYEVLHGRAEPCTVTKWNNMLDLTVLMFTLNYVGFDVIRRYYNEYFADNYHPQLRYDNLTSFFEEYNHLDRRAHMEYVYINPESAGEGMWEIINSGSQLCTTDINDGGRKLRRKQQLPDVSLARRAEGPVAVRADKRLVWIGRGDTNSADIPSLSTILGAIDSGQLSLHYARWEWASGTATGDVQGPFLELAYWIGPTPGVSTLNDQRFDMYRDQTPRPDRIGPDQWVVFHIHFEAPGRQPDFLAEGADGNTYAGTPTISVFHGQSAVPAYQDTFGNWVDWRVSGGEGLSTTARRTWSCPNRNSYYWLVGSPRFIEDDNAILAFFLHQWGQSVYRNGYLSTRGLRMILEAPNNNAMQPIDPVDPGFLTFPPGGRTTAFGGLHPYHRNFRIENGQIIPPPEQPPQQPPER